VLFIKIHQSTGSTDETRRLWILAAVSTVQVRQRRTAEIQSSNQQSLIDSYREQLYDSRAAASALAPTTFLACLSSIIAPCLRLQGKSHNLQGEFNPFRTAHEQAHGSRSSTDGPARPAHYAICATARIELP